MALDQKFYKEIFEKEEMWINMIDMNLINAYYLPEIRNFYEEKHKRLNYEFGITGNSIIKSISYAVNNIIIKLDYFINEDKNGNLVNLSELNYLFLINKLYNNIPYISKNIIKNTAKQKKDLYELRNKVVGDNLEDDFFYDNTKAI